MIVMPVGRTCAPGVIEADEALPLHVAVPALLSIVHPSLLPNFEIELFPVPVGPEITIQESVTPLAASKEITCPA